MPASDTQIVVGGQPPTQQPPAKAAPKKSAPKKADATTSQEDAA